MLVRCPECDRENVSDSAESCPNCGYEIKSHYNKIKQMQSEKIQSENAAISSKRAEAEKNKQKELRINNVSKPQKPGFNRTFVVYIAIMTCFLSWLMLYTPTTYFDPPHVGDWIFTLVVFIGFPLIIYLPHFMSKTNAFKLAQTDFEQYRRLIVSKQDIAEEDAKRQAEIKAKESPNSPHCPYCNSKDLKKISGLSKAGNVALWGIFALGKVSKQWHCNNCKSDF